MNPFPTKADAQAFIDAWPSRPASRKPLADIVRLNEAFEKLGEDGRPPRWANEKLVLYAIPPARRADS
jgi:hypothetical protein